MIKEKNIEQLENSAVKLSVTIEQAEAKKAYTELLNTYAKKAQIKGFRPGKVPTTVLEKKFGESMKMETAQNLIEKALGTLFQEIDERPLQYSTPQLESDLSFDPEQDFGFTVSYDIFPKVEVKDAKGITIEEPQVTIGKEDLQRELTALQEQNAIVTEDNKAPAAKDHIVTVNFVELDESGEPIPDTTREDFTFTIGTGYNTYKIDEDVTGMKVGEEKTVSKTYAEDDENKELAGRTVTLKITLTKVKIKDLPELDDELAQDIDEKFETLADLKKDIENRLKESAKAKVREAKSNSLVDGLIEKNPVILPQSMVRAELDANWQNFLRQFGGNEGLVLQVLQAQGSSKETLFEEWKPAAEKRLKGQLIIQKLIENEKIESTDEELTAEIQKQAEGSSMSEEETREYFEKNNLLDYLRHDIKERKLFDQLFETNTVKKGKKVNFLDLMQQNQ
jgi:trigger factor